KAVNASDQSSQLNFYHNQGAEDPELLLWSDKARRTPAGSDYRLSAVAVDASDVDLSEQIYWVSDIDGYLGTGGELDAVFHAPGFHRVTAHVVDQYGGYKAAELTVEVTE